MHKASVQICCEFLYPIFFKTSSQQSRDTFRNKCRNNSLSGLGCISNNVFLVPPAPFESEFSGGLEEESQKRLGT